MQRNKTKEVGADANTCQSCGRELTGALGPFGLFDEVDDRSQHFALRFCSNRCYHAYGLQTRPLVTISRSARPRRR